MTKFKKNAQREEKKKRTRTFTGKTDEMERSRTANTDFVICAERYVW